MRSNHHQTPPHIDNTCCPVCGTGISTDMLSVELIPQGETYGLHTAIRVDSRRCADIARAHPDAHLAAALSNQVAHT